MILDPSSKEKETLPQQRRMWDVLASQLNHIISEEQKTVLLTTELVSYQALEHAEAGVEPDEWWSLVLEVELGGELQFPNICNLALVCLTIFTSGSEAERDFSYMENIFPDSKSNFTGQELLDSKMVVNSSLKSEALRCARCIASKAERKERMEKGEQVPKREQCQHCHCSLVEIDDELLANLRNNEPSKKHKVMNVKKAHESAALKKELEEKSDEDKVEAEKDLQKEIADMKKRFQEARVAAIKENKDIKQVKIPKKRISIEKVDNNDLKKKKLAFLILPPKLDKEGNSTTDKNIPTNFDTKVANQKDKSKGIKSSVKKPKEKDSLTRLLKKKSDEEEDKMMKKQIIEGKRRV